LLTGYDAKLLGVKSYGIPTVMGAFRSTLPWQVKMGLATFVPQYIAGVAQREACGGWKE